MIPLFGKFFIFFALLVECFNGLVTYGDATFTLVWIIGEGADSGFSSVWVWRGCGWRPIQEPANSEGKLMFHLTERMSLSLFSLKEMVGVTGLQLVVLTGYNHPVPVFDYTAIAPKAGVMSSSIV